MNYAYYYQGLDSPFERNVDPTRSIYSVHVLGFMLPDPFTEDIDPGVAAPAL